MSDLKEKLKDRSPLRQTIEQVDLLKENKEIEASSRTTERPYLKFEDKSYRESVRRSYQFFYDQDAKIKKIQAYYSKKKGRDIPLSFFTKRAFDEYIARCFEKIREEGEI